MATINLGRIKPVNKGTWSNSTAYAIDDFVQYTDNGVLSTYIAVATSTNQTPSTSGTVNSTYWKFMAKGVASELSGISNNQIVIKNNSGNITGQSIGTAGQVLKVNSGANGYEFGTISSDFVKVAHSELSSDASSITLSNVFTTTYDIYDLYFQFTRDTQSQVYMEYEKASDSSFQNANYYFNSNMATRHNSTNSISSQGDWNYSNFRLHENQSDNATHNALWHIKFSRPAEALQTRWQHHCSQFDGSYSRELHGGGWNSNAEAHSGVKFTTTSGNMRAGSSVVIYGLKHA